MPIVSAKGIVLGSSNLGETDKIVTLYTEQYGKIKGVAKGARKIKSRFGGTLLPLNILDLIYFEKENRSLVSINSCEIAHSFHSIREDFERLKRGLYLIELVDVVLKERQKNRQVFDLLISIIKQIESVDLNRIESLLRIFELRVLSHVGYRPLLDKCIKCGVSVKEKDRYRFSPLHGGIVCHQCFLDSRESMDISPGALNFMNKVFVWNLQRLERLRLSSELNSELISILHAYIEIHMGKLPRSARFLDK
jgi:DNA repair protein RecO (recombination protein O)